MFNPFALFSSTFLLILSLNSHAAPIVLPDIGDNAGEVSRTEEYQTGQAVIRNIRRVGGIIDDPLIQTYLDELGYRLVSALENPNSFHFFIINDRGINAFALPGGFIGVNVGLILASKTESELAGVIAHEIAHVSQRHFARRYEQNSNSIPIVAALIAAILLGSQDNQVGQAALASVAAGTAQKQINFTRANEKEADRMGINLLIKAGFNPHGMAAFFETMERQTRFYGESIPEFLRTHPVNPARISDAKHRTRGYPNVLTDDPLNYYLLRTRLNVLTNHDNKALLKNYSAELKQSRYDNKASTQYGLALALRANKKYAQALKQVKKLLKDNPELISYNILKARIETDTKEYKTAIKTYKKLLNLYPNNKNIQLYYAEALIEAKNYKSAHTLLQQLSTSAPSPQIFLLLAETQAKLGLTANSHYSLAENFYLLGQTHEAIKQLEISLSSPNIDFYLTSRLEARLIQLKSELQ